MDKPGFVVLDFGSDLQRQSVELREELLRKPLGLRFSEEELAAERDEFHLAMVSGSPGNEEVVAVLLLKKTGRPDAIQMRQVATKLHMQGKGLGAALVGESEQFARDQGFTEMVLHAREPVVPFYLRLGYQVVSDRFTEVGIPHFKMRKNLIT